MWKYNPNYNLRFPSSPKIKFPEIKLKKAEVVDKVEHHIVNNNADKESSVIHEHHGDLNLTSNSEIKDNSHHPTDETKRPHHNHKNSAKHKKSIEPIVEEKVPFSRHNKALPFSKYLSRKSEDISITANIPFMVTEPSM